MICIIRVFLLQKCPDFLLYSRKPLLCFAMKRFLCFLFLVGVLACPRVRAATEIVRHKHALMSRSERDVNFWIYGICDLLVETNEYGSIVGATLCYTGGVFANYNHGGASGRADEIITHCQSFVRENEPTVAMWIYDYDLSRYGSGASGKGSGGGICNLCDLFPSLYH